MHRFRAAIAAGILSASAAGCSTPAEQALGSAVIGSLTGAMSGASLGRPEAAVGSGATSGSAAADGTASKGAGGGPDYGAKKPHNHCGNGTMVHLGSVICSP